MQAKTELASKGVEVPAKRVATLLEKPPAEVVKRIPDLVADLRFDKLSYSEAGQVVQQIETFCTGNRDRLLVNGHGLGEDYWHRGEIPFFSEDQKQDQQYVKTYTELLKLAEVNEGLNAYKSWIGNNPDALKDPSLGEEDKVYRFVRGGESGHFRIDADNRHILKRNGGNADHLFSQEARNSGQFKIDAAACQNLRLEPDAIGDSGWIQLHPKIGQPQPEQIGRVYINPSTGDYLSRSNVITLFEYFAKQFNANPDLYHSMKVYDFKNRLPWAFSPGASKMIEGELNMSDKIVIYFDMNKYGDVLKELQNQYERLYEPHQLLYPDHPLFSVTLPNNPEALGNRHFKSMYGISFAEDPVTIKGEQTRSRNQTIAEVLRRATKEVGVEKVSSEDFDEAVRKQFEYFKIDPDNPAFNLRPKALDADRIPGNPALVREHESKWRSLQKAS